LDSWEDLAAYLAPRPELVAVDVVQPGRGGGGYQRAMADGAQLMRQSEGDGLCVSGRRRPPKVTVMKAAASSASPTPSFTSLSACSPPRGSQRRCAGGWFSVCAAHVACRPWLAKAALTAAAHAAVFALRGSPAGPVRGRVVLRDALADGEGSEVALGVVLPEGRRLTISVMTQLVMASQKVGA
jgi:hypothetical protein